MLSQHCDSVPDCGEGDFAVRDYGGVAGVEVGDGLAIRKYAIDVKSPSGFGKKAYQHPVPIIISQHRMHVECLLPSAGDDWI